MVNTGRPSRACDPCKARHTKCDERRPRCSRCKKAGRKCTGYKDDFEINHRNETNLVAQRVRARQAYSQGLLNQLPVPYRTQASALFIENFVLEPPNRTYSRGYLAGLLPLLRTTKSDSLLSTTIDAVGLCFLATSMVNDSIASQAARGYLRSLNRLKASLDHDVDCISTETMMSIYLMGLYEMLMPPENTTHPWVAHLKGLTAIIKAYNKKTGRCLPGIGFFIAVDNSLDRSTWVVNENAPVDGWFLDWSRYDERIVYSDFVAQDPLTPKPAMNHMSRPTSLDDLILRTLPLLQAAPSLLETHRPEGESQVQQLLTTARFELSSFLVWPSRIPSNWQPQPIHHEFNELEIFQLDIFLGGVELYSDLYVAAVWNTYRTTLLWLCDTIAQCGKYLETSALPFGETEEYRSLRTIAETASKGICSSVTYHIDHDRLNRIITDNLDKSPKALGGLFLIWPLYGGSILSIVPDIHRAWMRQKLRSIGTSMGLAQAIILADTVDLYSTTDPLKPLIIAQGHVFMWSASIF